MIFVACLTKKRILIAELCTFMQIIAAVHISIEFSDLPISEEISEFNLR